MRVTVDIDEKKIAEILKITKQKKKSPAISQALEEFIDYRKRQAFLKKVLDGKTDYSSTNIEIEKIARLEP